jgi:ATP/maltotriose-dependent transcriptional regulator MalT
MLHDWAIGDQRRAHAIATGLTELGCKIALSYYGSLLADNQAESGQLDAAIASIDHCLSLCRDNDEHFYEPELYRRRAMYEARRAPTAGGVQASLRRAAELARQHDMSRIEMLATLELCRRFGGDAQHRERLDQLLAHSPHLRAIRLDIMKE